MSLRWPAFIIGLLLIGVGAYGLLIQSPMTNTLNNLFTIGGFTVSFAQVFFGFPLFSTKLPSVQPVLLSPKPKPVPQSQGMYYESGIGLILGSFFLLLSSFLTLAVNSLESPLFVLSLVTLLIVGILYPLSLPRLHKKQANGAGQIGQIGLVIVIIAWLTNDLMVLILLTSRNQILAGEPLPPSFTIISHLYPFLLLLPGNILLAIAIIRASVFPNWIGIVFIAVAVIGIIGALEPFSYTIFTISALSSMFLAASYVRCGYILCTS